ncbi:MAG TPA: hydantoinase/oxoprolinase family protein [Syntrophorhabdaceae bacterium]|nr:hydantoinase/oxoprolinase family protein [Syntrophorhabdaceae bacterium]HOL05972.1 hydantoinase/oxoprolinase family protein [Syntrophorhabdaceae bacterium]HOT41696.1 hydantoinase/oxoprolinase family protein [Syntrophorhabdaceae bacterium]HPP42388.1 hydantoinase/oxoprolinase family protein [Syntrophorhabdaceae bacterium]HQH43696.1 hydantoinase/oxoprolinase family protein [Syntrophorhabdaceae bacterium]
MRDKHFRLGCDIGGTFTDFVLLDDETGEIKTGKCLTTPRDPSDAVEEGIRALEKTTPDFVGKLDELIHGTTLVINSIIERKGARTGLITTKGFRDILEIGREIRYAPYDIFAEFPKPLVPRRYRVEVDERIRSDGTILKPLDHEDARRAVKSLIDMGVESIAVCLINSFENPVHEKMIEEIIKEEAPWVSTSISYRVLPQIKEYERTSTTVTNAYVKPLTGRYLSKLSDRLASIGFRGKLFIMLSSGGITSVETAAEFPVRIIESGPTAAVIAGQYYGKHFNIPEMFCFDMGGTTAKSCLIQKGVAGVVPTFEVGRVQRFMKGSGLTIQVPVVDLMEIGAGGGSIAKVSKLGTLQVGPESSGADPGPICYGRGGTEPCVTDADLLLGYLDENYFLGGEMRLDKESARRGVEEKIAKPLGVSFVQAIWGIHDLINETMAAAAKTHIAEKGGNPKIVTIAAFGGAGPVHAYGLAKKLEAPRLIVPPNAGVGSAMGFFTAPRAFDLVRSHKVALNSVDFADIENIFLDMEKEAVQILKKESGEETIRFDRSLDMRFVGQGSEVNIPAPPGDFRGHNREQIRRLFDDVYEKLYGRTYPDSEVEFINFKIRASLPERLLQLPRLEKKKDQTIDAAIKGTRPAYSNIAKDFIPYTVYDRYKLFPGAGFNGPAIIEERESTLIVGEDAYVRMDDYGFLWIDLKEVR